MKPILSAIEMKKCDQMTIEQHQVPGFVLMERAALAVCDYITEKYDRENKICILCGPGNNGGDGVAVARMLKLKRYKVTVVILGDESKFTDQLQQEIVIAMTYDVRIKNYLDLDIIENGDVVVDALFGIGLSRGLSGEYEQAVELVNSLDKPVVAVDIPSGYSTDSGKLLGKVGIKADTTITFAYMKKGLLLGECKEAAGNIVVADVGIYLDDESVIKAKLLEEDVLKDIPVRKPTANKGDCGKLLIIAGSENIYGACYLAAEAALVTGAGLVKIFTHKNNVNTIQQSLPEAMYYGYESFEENVLAKAMEWADVVLIGPGLGTSEVSKKIVKTVLEYASRKLVIDADGLNICAQKPELLKAAAKRIDIVITPHLKEMERLCKAPVNDINYNIEKVALDFAKEYGLTVVLKNFTTVIAKEDRAYYCTSGNEALATPGSGDVLAGIIASLMGQNMSSEQAAIVGAFFHGYAGKNVSKKIGVKSVLARDIIAELKG